MEFDHLRGFYYVAKLGSFTEAATRLYVTQPAISLQVKALEKEIGEKLFDRFGRTIRLTHAGQMLLRHVEELITKLNEIQRTVGELRRVEGGRLYLGASDTTSMYFLPDLLKSFLREHSKVELSITSLLTAQVLRKVLDRELDLGIVTLGEIPAPLAAIPLFRQRLVCIACKDHSLAERKVVSLPDLSGEALILLEKQSVTRQQLDAHFRRADCACRPILELSNFEIIKCYVAAGLGVSLVPEAAVSHATEGICVIPLQRPPTFDVGVVHRRDREFSQAAQAFLAMAREHFKKPARNGVCGVLNEVS